MAVCASWGQEFMVPGAEFRSLGRPHEARAAFEQVVVLLTKKGIIPGVAYARRLIAEL